MAGHLRALGHPVRKDGERQGTPLSACLSQGFPAAPSRASGTDGNGLAQLVGGREDPNSPGSFSPALWSPALGAAATAPT